MKQDILIVIKAEAERQAMYANTDGEPCSDTSCDASHWLDMAAKEIERLRALISDAKDRFDEIAVTLKRL